MKLSVIVPIAPSENVEIQFLDSLKMLPAGSELVFVSVNDTVPDNINIIIPGIDVRYLPAKSGRAHCLNAGISDSSGDYLWFLHADSRFGRNAVPSLLAAIGRHPGALLYFDIVFDDAPVLMKLNEWGVYFRTRFLNTPFGDQGLCIRKDICSLLGGFSEDAPYGEDYLFVRNALRKDIPVKPVRAVLHTSARKYRKNGWFKTTVLHLYLWRKQVCADNKKHKGVNI